MPESMTHQSDQAPPGWSYLRVLAAVECWLGAGCLLIGLAVLALWRLSDPSNAPHGGLLLLAAGSPFVFGGLALLVAGGVLRRADGWRWTGHVLPLVMLAFVFMAPSAALAWATFMLARLIGPWN
jgi:hypothetical protein